MPLLTSKLEADIKALLNDMLTKDTKSVDQFAAELSTAIEAFVKSGLVSVNVATTGGPAAQTGTGTGTIS